MEKHLESFESACAFLGIEPVLPIVEGIEENQGKALISVHKLSTITSAAWKHAGVEIDWSNYNQRKFVPFFDLEGSPSGFSFSDCYYAYTLSGVWSRLVFPDVDSLKFVVETHLEEYRNFMCK
jgi:hypothetical protein